MPMLHEEATFEDDICTALAGKGWLHHYGDFQQYDRERALFPSDLVDWVKETEPEAWEALEKRHGTEEAATKLLDRMRRSLDERGTIEVLRGGIDMVGLRRTLKLAQFRPASGLNPDIMRRYEANRLRVVQQVRYTVDSEKSIDLVFFLNGIPVATAELKTDYTQSVADAMDQYRRDRLPHPKGGRAEPLLSFPSGAIVHFALSDSDVMMTTKLAGPKTRFLPFNQGRSNGGAGNDPVPFGAATAYLWEQVLAPDSWLEIIGRYVTLKRDKKGQPDTLFFPRYHQLDATRKLVEAVDEEGAGGAYLIQHSAGSGKTASIAWTAHFLSELHDDDDRKLFATVIVVSDRRVIDGQLQEALFSFERTAGVVETVSESGGTKSEQLAEALADGKKIIACTIQTFPYALEAVRDAASTTGKSFAVVADEAHSSQTGEAAAKLRELLAGEAGDDGKEIDTEDLLAAQMAARAGETGITYVAFTATPKNKTLELFGRLENPDAAPSEANRFRPFHLYSMRQAIEEGFILDVLKNYTPYKTAFKLAQRGKALPDDEVERSAAVKKIMRWVRLHPHNIAQKVQITVEHFLENVAPLLNGEAKAMVVLGSRKEAVRWKVAVDKYIASQGYRGIRALVAFSGEVDDHESFPEPVRETSDSLNSGLKGRDIREAFDDADARLLLVANKFQTGFDEPRLCGMYVDRRLAGVQAVQTLSRLNRAYAGKDTVYILDFLNSADDVLTAFRQYYETAELADATDPDQVFDLMAKLDDGGWYDVRDVDRVVDAWRAQSQRKLTAALQPVAQRLIDRYAGAQQRTGDDADPDSPDISDAKDEIAALEQMKGDMQAYVKLYTYLSQVLDYGNTSAEKRAIFYKYLVRLLDFRRTRTIVDLSDIELTHHAVRSDGRRDMQLGDEDADPLQPVTATGTGSIQEKQKARLAEIIEKVNTLFEGDLSDGDQLSYLNAVASKLLESTRLKQQAKANSKAQFDASSAIDPELLEAAIDAMEAHEKMGAQVINSARVRAGLKDLLLNIYDLHGALREGSEAPENIAT